MDKIMEICKISKINEGVCKFVGCYDAATKQKSSGQSEDDVLKMAHDIFFNDYKSKFTLEHAWLELRHDQKWCGGLASKENVSSKRRKLDDQSPQSSTSVPCSLGGDEPTARPAGVKAVVMRNPPPPPSPTPTTSPSRSIEKRNSLPRIGQNFPERAILAALKEQSCSICLENLTHRRAAVIPSCRHGYCLGCIRKWSGVKRTCPLCNARFDSWLVVNDLASRTFREERLPLLRDRQTVTYHRRNIIPSGRRRTIPRSTDVLESSSSRRSRPLPWRRSFGRPGSVPDHVILERKLRWRASIYDRQLRAVRLHSRSSLLLVNDDHTKARITERIEPWMRREVQAVLGDPDPSIVVHFASALFIKRLERENNGQSGQGGGILVEDQVSSSLGIFLGDKEDIFWHELRCFAESSLTMETYDAVVEYNEVE